MDVWDAVVIGGGHNGLVAAAYLARAGRRVLVLERRPVLGGCAVTEELWPRFRVSRAAYVASLVRPVILEELHLAAHGLRFLPREPSSFTPLPDGRHLLLGADTAQNVEAIGRFSRRDAARWPRYEAMLEGAARLVEPLLDHAPFDPLRPRLADLRPVGTALGRALDTPRSVVDMATLLTTPAGTILTRWFESDALRATLATDSVIGAMVAPSSPGSGYVLLHHVMGEAGGARGRWAYVRGGMGAFSEAIASAARASGATIETDADVAHVRIEGGRAAGVVLTDGREIRATQVLSGVDPHVTFLRLVAPEHLPSAVRRRVQRMDFSAAAVKINLALDRLPHFTARPPDGDGRELRGTIHLAPTLAGIEAAYRDAVAGEPSREPIVEMTIPSTVDDSLAPPGRHVASLFVQYAPYAPAGGGWDAPGAREAFARRVFALVERYAPGFTASIRHHEVLTPLDMERLFGLTGGNIFHGAMTRGQLHALRPIPGWSGYRTPIPGLLLCGAGAHPGGGVMGACGRNAALVALREA